MGHVEKVPLFRGTKKIILKILQDIQTNIGHMLQRVRPSWGWVTLATCAYLKWGLLKSRVDKYSLLLTSSIRRRFMMWSCNEDKTRQVDNNFLPNKAVGILSQKYFI